MERVIFVIERSGERIPALLNPEFMETRRTSGLRRRSGAGGAVMGSARSDDPLIATGGGTTEYDLYLLFDTDIAREGQAAALPVAAPLPAPREGVQAPLPASLPPQRQSDVRELTRPIWNLSENALAEDGSAAPPSVRFLWGKSWNVPGVVVAAAERLERFDANGAPQRSWLSLRLRRVEEPVPSNPPALPTSPQFETPALAPSDLESMAQDYDSVLVSVDAEGAPLLPLFLVAQENYGDARLAPAIARFNGLDDYLRMPEGMTLLLPPLTVLMQAG